MIQRKKSRQQKQKKRRTRQKPRIRVDQTAAPEWLRKEVNAGFDGITRNLIPTSTKLLSNPQPPLPEVHCQPLDVNPVWDYVESGAEIDTGDSTTAKRDIIEEIGRSAGLTYADDELLHTTEKIEHRDRRRWELDPASSDT